MRITGIPDEETATKVFQSLQAQNPKRFSGFSYVDGEMRVVMPGKQITVAQQDAFHDEMLPLLERARDDAGLPVDHDLEYDGVNLQIVKGKYGGDSVQGHSGESGGRAALDDPSDAQTRAELEAAVERIRAARPAAAAKPAPRACRPTLRHPSLQPGR